jgi:hypothetical protein
MTSSESLQESQLISSGIVNVAQGEDWVPDQHKCLQTWIAWIDELFGQREF